MVPWWGLCCFELSDQHMGVCSCCFFCVCRAQFLTPQFHAPNHRGENRTHSLHLTSINDDGAASVLMGKVGGETFIIWLLEPIPKRFVRLRRSMCYTTLSISSQWSPLIPPEWKTQRWRHSRRAHGGECLLIKIIQFSVTTTLNEISPGLLGALFQSNVNGLWGRPIVETEAAYGVVEAPPSSTLSASTSVRIAMFVALSITWLIWWADYCYGIQVVSLCKEKCFCLTFFVLFELMPLELKIDWS